jgi:hypothetical protein
MSVTYRPKIEKVRDGTIRHTIRVNQRRPKAVGDLLRIYTWSGRPYHSKQEVLCWGRVTDIYHIIISRRGIRFLDGGQTFNEFEGWNLLTDLAVADGIDPPTGTELGRVLLAKNPGIGREGVPGQVIRWEWLGLQKPPESPEVPRISTNDMPDRESPACNPPANRPYNM